MINTTNVTRMSGNHQFYLVVIMNNGDKYELDAGVMSKQELIDEIADMEDKLETNKFIELRGMTGTKDYGLIVNTKHVVNVSYFRKSTY